MRSCPRNTQHPALTLTLSFPRSLSGAPALVGSAQWPWWPHRTNEVFVGWFVCVHRSRARQPWFGHLMRYKEHQRTKADKKTEQNMFKATAFGNSNEGPLWPTYHWLEFSALAPKPGPSPVHCVPCRAISGPFPSTPVSHCWAHTLLQAFLNLFALLVLMALITKVEPWHAPIVAVDSHLTRRTDLWKIIAPGTLSKKGLWLDSRVLCLEALSSQPHGIEQANGGRKQDTRPPSLKWRLLSQGRFSNCLKSGWPNKHFYFDICIYCIYINIKTYKLNTYKIQRISIYPLTMDCGDPPSAPQPLKIGASMAQGWLDSFAICRKNNTPVLACLDDCPHQGFWYEGQGPSQGSAGLLIHVPCGHGLLDVLAQRSRSSAPFVQCVDTCGDALVTFNTCHEHVMWKWHGGPSIMSTWRCQRGDRRTKIRPEGPKDVQECELASTRPLLLLFTFEMKIRFW